MVDPHIRCGRFGRAPPSRASATGVERREEHPFGIRWRLDLMEKERGGAALRKRSKLVCPWGCPLLIYL